MHICKKTKSFKNSDAGASSSLLQSQGHVPSPWDRSLVKVRRAPKQTSEEQSFAHSGGKLTSKVTSMASKCKSINPKGHLGSPYVGLDMVKLRGRIQARSKPPQNGNGQMNARGQSDASCCLVSFEWDLSLDRKAHFWYTSSSTNAKACVKIWELFDVKNYCSKSSDRRSLVQVCSAILREYASKLLSDVRWVARD